MPVTGYSLIVCSFSAGYCHFQISTMQAPIIFSSFVAFLIFLVCGKAWNRCLVGLWCFEINSTYLKLNTTFLLPSECYWRGLFNLSEKTGNNCLWRKTTQEVRYEAKSKPQSFKLNPKLKTKGHLTSSAIRLRGPPEGREALVLRKDRVNFCRK